MNGSGRNVLAAVACAGAAALPGLGHAADDESASETAGRWLGASNEAVQAFGKSGESLGVVTAKSFVDAGTGSAKRSLANGWNAAAQSYQATTAATKASVPYSVAPTVFTGAEVLNLMAPAIEGDGKGVVSGAANIGAASLVAAEGAAAGAKLFGMVGGAVGSFIPVVGTAAGAMVGGAIGTVTGGFVASIAYDRYGKSVLTKVVEGGLSALTDPDPLQVAIAAREDFMRKQAAPELQANWDYAVGVSQGFGQEEAIISKPLTGVYQPRVAPSPPVAAVQPFTFEGIRKIEISSWVDPSFKVTVVCDVAGDRLTCAGSGTFTSGTVSGQQKIRQTGTIDGADVVFTEHVEITYQHSDTGCREVYDVDSRSRHTLLADGRETFRTLGSTGRWTSSAGNCGAAKPFGVPEVNNAQYTGAGSWSQLQ